MVIKTQIAPPPPERPNNNRARRYLLSLKSVLLAQHYDSQHDRQNDWDCLVQLWESLVPDEPSMAPACSSSQRRSLATAEARPVLLSLEGVILAKIYKCQSDGDADLDCLVQLWHSLVLEADLTRSGQPNSSETKQTFKPPSPEMEALWQEVIAEISEQYSLLGLVLAHQTRLVKTRRTFVQVMVQADWLANVQADSLLIEETLQTVWGRKDLGIAFQPVAELPPIAEEASPD